MIKHSLNTLGVIVLLVLAAQAAQAAAPNGLPPIDTCKLFCKPSPGPTPPK